MRNYTEEQKQAIYNRSDELLVSAAAGSGKTAVLVERILKMVLEGASIDKLLVVTFTNDAAAEMKERLTAAFSSYVSENRDIRMKRQLALLSNANISTMHSFCNRIISNYFNLVGLSPNFRLLAESEINIIKNEIIKETFETAYENESFSKLAEIFSTGFSDEPLQNTILKLYDFSVKQLNPMEWLETAIKPYEYWKTLLKEYKENCRKKCIALINEAIELCGLYTFMETLEDDLRQLEELPLDQITFSRAKSSKGEDKELKKQSDDLRKKVKELIKNIPRENEVELQTMNSHIDLLIKTTIDFANNFKTEKLSKNAVDFNDLEHYAIEILKHDNVNFDFEEILIDEYQDSNDIQEYILTRVASNSVSSNNIKTRRFMVGDSKQSIYAFRGTGPELFFKKYETVEKLILSKNFRSSETVINTVNNVFQNIMPGYDKNSMLYKGIELKGEKTESYLVKGREITFIASKIKELSNIYNYNDIAVLVRSKSIISELVNELKIRGIPSFSEDNVGFFENPEIKLITNILSIVDNPFQDIPLMAVLTSPLYELSMDELLKIRKDNKNLSLYESLKSYGHKEFFLNLEKWRENARKLNIEDFLIEIIVENKLFSYTRKSSARDNLRILLTIAKEYEGGLFSFINYLEQHTRRKISLSEAASSEGVNMVRIMTIHKSKGLEFPVVFVASMNKVFNTDDTKKDIIFHKKHGIVFKNLDLEKHIKTPTMPHSVLSKIIIDENIEEEKRVLYVAFTRAREKLILTGQKKEKKTNSYVQLLENSIDFEELEVSEETFKEELIKEAEKLLPDNDIRISKVKKFIESEYKYKDDINLPANISISEIKRNFYNQNAKIGEVESVIDKSFFSKLPTPSFLNKENEAAKRGTLLHLVMENLNLSIHNENNLDELLKTVLAEDELKEINREFITNFMNSNIAIRLKKASNIKKETPFAMELSSKELFLEQDFLEKEAGKGILVHGIIDLYFEENGEIVLLDYKSDNLTDKSEIKERYKIQLDIYKKALESITGKKVKEVIIYMFRTCEEILID
ncbi:MAG: UvrD-helicase domain-containing protein [Defluviitaleaceae bacterium]|nr:UvrD-helicase domain-containing protein [Defluviitaleaceae bacterium]